jgi:hypothetical protein
MRERDTNQQNGGPTGRLVKTSHNTTVIVKGRQVRCAEVQRHVSDINLIILELDNCIVSHVYREGNRAADKFAQIGHHMENPRVWRHNPPDEVLEIVHEDAQGKIVLRRR